MGKNHRHKKDLKADKAKVKLKQSKTKFLPKGLNVTNTSFKIKPIVLVEQLKEKQNDFALSRRKLNVKDLMNRMNHYNENVRFDACEELSAMFKIHSVELINQNLSEIISKACCLMQDRERKVRKAAAKVVNTVLEIAPKEKLEPFFEYFSTNMRCAMTNIDKNIQEDSLLFLDCFLKSDCGLVSKTSEKLLPDFFTLISKLRNESTVERTLTVNLGSKMTSVTWRIKVLSRLHAVLESILTAHISTTDLPNKTTKEIFVHDNTPSNFPIYKDGLIKKLDNSSVPVFDNSQNISTSDTLDRHIIMLVPLLYETWIEVVPDKKLSKTVNERTCLDEEASAILSCIMSTLYLLWKYVTKLGESSDNVKNIFLSAEGKKFLNHLLVNFPYCLTASRSNAKSKFNKLNGTFKELNENNDPKCEKENILICYIYCILNVNYNSRVNLKKELEVIMNYINVCLVAKKHINHMTMQYLIEFLNISLIENPQLWIRSGADLKLLLENTIVFYNKIVREEYKLQLFTILSGIIDIPQLERSLPYKQWLSSLPDVLCQPKISDVVVRYLLVLSRKNNMIFYAAFLNKLPEILENLGSVRIVLTEPYSINTEETVKRNMVNILFFVPILNQENLKHINSFIAQHPNSSYSLYFRDMLQLRSTLKYNG